MDFTVEQFRAGCGATLSNAQIYYPWVAQACERYRINQSAQHLAAFFGQIAVESAQLAKVEEDLYYRDAERLAKLFLRVFDKDQNRVITQDEIEAARPYCRMPKELSMKLYNGYHGRGLGQLTWEKNYRKIGSYVGADYVGNPDMVKSPEHAALSFAAFWDVNRINDVADDISEVTLRVNGPRRLHLAERLKFTAEALAALRG